jgi:hypothetical protein
MKLKATAIGALLLLSLLFVSVPKLFGVKIVKAANAGVIYGPNYHIEYLDLPGEEQLTRDVCTYIMNMFVSYGYNYGWLYKCVDSAATRSAYGSNVYYAETHYSAATVFTKGHAAEYKCNPNGPKHHYLMDTNGLHVEDDYIWSNTPYGRHRFVCTWHCGTTMDYPGTICPYCGGRTSLPYAWTHSNTMNLEAYTSSTGDYVYIGHEGYSPQFLNPTGWGNYNHAHYVYYLYLYLLQYHMNVRDAASWAAYYAFGNYYLPATQLYTLHWVDPSDPPPPNPPFPGYWSRMHIFGNGNLGLPAY